MSESISVKHSLQGGLTSSTYRAIAAKKSLIPTSDRPFSEQQDIQEFLNSPSNGIVPEILLYRLLAVVELALQQKFPDTQFDGLCLGYTLETVETNAKNSGVFYVSWGWNPIYTKLTELTAHGKIVDEVTDQGNIGSLQPQELSQEETNIHDEFLILKNFVEAEIQSRAKKDALENKKICAFLFGHLNHKSSISALPQTDEKNNTSGDRAEDSKIDSQWSHSVRTFSTRSFSPNMILFGLGGCGSCTLSSGESGRTNGRGGCVPC